MHLIGPEGAIYGQHDAPPLTGQRPTTSWVTSEFIDDPYEVELAPQAPPGRYVARVGLYDEATGQRIPLKNGPGGAVDLFDFQVVP